MSGVVKHVVFVRQNPGRQRPEPGTVVPIRTPWRSLLEMANARRLEGIEARERGADDLAWSFVDDARELERRAYELRAIETAAIEAQRGRR